MRRTTSLIARSATVVLAAWLLSGTQPGRADAGQTPTTAGGGHQHDAQANSQTNDQTDRDAVQRHDEMMARMKAADEQIAALATKMSSARGTAKIDAMAELLTVVVEERTAMRSSMQAHDEMMQRMTSASAKMKDMHERMMMNHQVPEPTRP